MDLCTIAKDKSNLKSYDLLESYSDSRSRSRSRKSSPQRNNSPKKKQRTYSASTQRRYGKTLRAGLNIQENHNGVNEIKSPENLDLVPTQEELKNQFNFI